MAAYADETYFVYTYCGVTGDRITRELTDASGDVDVLTFNQIVAMGFESLTDFQQGVIKDVVCGLVDFKRENADLIDSPYSAYSINGVSMSSGNTDTVKTIQGIMIPLRLYKKLISTGLCYLGVD